jgi:hypothetical protein
LRWNPRLVGCGAAEISPTAPVATAAPAATPADPNNRRREIRSLIPMFTVTPPLTSVTETSVVRSRVHPSYATPPAGRGRPHSSVREVRPHSSPLVPRCQQVDQSLSILSQHRAPVVPTEAPRRPDQRGGTSRCPQPRPRSTSRSAPPIRAIPPWLPSRPRECPAPGNPPVDQGC